MSHGERELTREDVPKLRPEPPAPQPRGAGAHAWASLRARDVLGLQRGAGNQAVARAVTQLRRRQIQRFTDEDMQKVTVSSKLPADQVQVMLEVGEATGLSAEVMEAATSPLNLNPDGLYTMLGSFRAIVKDKKTPTKGETSNPSTAAPPRGAAGFVRELLYGLQHMRQGRYRAVRSDAPRRPARCALGRRPDHPGGDDQGEQQVRSPRPALGWGRRRLGQRQARGGVRLRKRCSTRWSTARRRAPWPTSSATRSISSPAGTRSCRSRGPGVRPTSWCWRPNELAKAQPEKFIDLIERRLSEEVGGTALAALVDRVRISAVTCQVEYDVKSGKPTIVKFEDEQSGESPRRRWTPRRRVSGTNPRSTAGEPPAQAESGGAEGRQDELR